MSSIKSSREFDAVIHDPEELRGRSPFFFLIGFLLALGLTAALVGGYFYLRSRHAAQTLATEQQQKNAAAEKPLPKPEVRIFEDQAKIKGAQALLEGTVENISSAPMNDLSIELQLIPRMADARAVRRTLALTPKDLAPGERGQYSLTVLSRDYKQARVVSVKSSSRAGEIAFATAPGAQRPAGPPASNNKTVIINRPSPKNSNGDFINSPDNPTTIR
jgi:hypothetical protein